MADITLKLIWYKLGESGGKMAEWYSNLNWEDHILDFLLVGWIVWSALLVLVANGLSKIIGPLRVRAYGRKKETSGGSSNARAVTGTESCQWLNNGINWFFLNYYRQADFIDAWIRHLNVEVKKLGGPVQIKFEKVESGSLPPKFSDFSSQIGQDDKFILQGHVESRDMAFVVFASQTTHEGVKLTNCTAKILRLKGKLRVLIEKVKGEAKVSISFDGKPDIKTNVKPSNPFQDSDELVDLGAVDEAVRNAIALASPNYNISKWLMDDPQSAGRTSAKVPGGQSSQGGQGHVPATNHMSAVNERMTSTANQLAQSANQYAAPANQYAAAANQFAADFSQSAAPQLYTSSPIQQGPPSAKPRTSQTPKERLPRPEGVFEPIEARQAEQSFQTAMSPIKPPRSAGDKRLLVKVIKASGLGPKETGQVEPVCLLLLDDPVQNYSTSAVKNTINPFWDEHFLFDVTNETRELRLEVYDRAKAPGEFIGESVIFIDDLRKTPSTRQILALQSKPGYVDSPCGSLTVEFLFMDPSEADLLLDISAAASNQISPKRRIETGRTITPGGTVVTTTTTTTEKSPYASQDPGLDGSPHLVQKHHVNPDYSSSECSGGRSSPFVLTNDTSSMSASSEMIVVNGIGESVSDAAIRELSDRSKKTRTPAKTSTLLITGVKRTIESTPTDESGGFASHQRERSTPDKEKKKSSFGSALKKAFGLKKRAHSADRETSSYKEGRYLKPPEQAYGPQSKDDLELVRAKGNASPNLKKSRSLGGSLKKLFRRSRRRSKSRDNSRDSSFKTTGSQNPSRDSSLNRSTNRASVS